MRRITLSQGKVALVDDDDYQRLSKYRWWLGPRGNHAVTQKGRTTIYMHRLVKPCPKGKFVDHINGNNLDNRKANLRICEHRFNRANSKLSSNNKSGYKGVWWSKKDKRWIAGIRVNYERTILGYFKDPKEAALAYNQAATEAWGEYARLNPT